MDPTTWPVIIGLVGAFGSVLAIVLTRKGKKEDQKLAERQTAYEELLQLSDARAEEITRLREELAAARADAQARMDRQVQRCRAIRTELLQAIARNDNAAISDALRGLREHHEDDHGGR